MQHTVKASKAGTITEIYFNAGDLVDGGAALLELKIDDSQEDIREPN